MPARGLHVPPTSIATSQVPQSFAGWITSTSTIPALSSLRSSHDTPASLTAGQSLRIPRGVYNVDELVFCLADPAGADGKTCTVNVWHEYERLTSGGAVIGYRYEPAMVLALTAGAGQIALTDGVLASALSPPASISDAGDLTWVDTCTITDYSRTPGAQKTGEVADCGGVAISWDGFGAKSIIVASAVSSGQGLGVFHRGV